MGCNYRSTHYRPSMKTLYRQLQGRGYFSGCQPQTLRRDTLQKLKVCLVSPKSDGVRAHLLFGVDERDRDCFAIVNRKTTIDTSMRDCVESTYQGEIEGRLRHVPNDDLNLFDGTLLDAELMEDCSFVIFDALTVCGLSLHEMPFWKRLEVLRDLEPTLRKHVQKDFEFSIKPWLPATRENVKRSIEARGDSDGLIFYPRDSPVRLGRAMDLFKWKQDNTLDFEIREGRAYFMQSRNRVNVETLRIRVNCADLANGIYEFRAKKGGTWTMMKARPFKERANDVVTVKRTLLTIEENITLEDIREVL